jgi:hypothetical protein
MLFDLRARGRRRTVQVVYLALAILFGLGFVGFGVGGGFGGGGVLEGVFGNKEGSNSSSYAKQISAAEARTRKYPAEAAAWAALADARIHEANGSEFYEEAKAQFTSQGKELLTKVADAWDRYVALNPSKPDATVAQEMLRVFGEEGLNQPAAAVEVMQLVIAAKPPSAALYGRLAAYAYQAKNTRVGDLASQKTISLTPAAQRKKVEAELERIKKNPTGNASGEASASGAGGQTVQVNTGSTTTSTGTATVPAPAKKK